MILLVASPVTSEWVVGRILELAVVLGLLSAGLLAAQGTTSGSIFAVSLGVIMIFAGSIRLFGPEPPWVTLLWLMSGAVFFFHVTYVLALDIFTSTDRITSGRLYGAVSVYLLVGLIFANAHLGLETIAPGSYHCGSPQCNTGYQPSVFLYFSFITLCSVGYGDILPATRAAGMLAYLEAIVGQMYVAILVSRLVGMHLAETKT